MATSNTKNLNDLRVRRTYKLLSQALLSLLLEKPFEEIFVTDICETAMVHRTTFYKHFQDKYQLLDFCVQELIRNFEEGDHPLPSTDNVKEYYMSLIRKSLEYMAANKELFLTGILNSGDNSVVPMLNNSVSSLIETKLTENEKLGIRHSIPSSVIAQFYSGALLSTSIWWLKNNDAITIDQMIHYIRLLMNETSFTIRE